MPRPSWSVAYGVCVIVAQHFAALIRDGRWFVTHLQLLFVVCCCCCCYCFLLLLYGGHSLSPHAFYLTLLFALLIFGLFKSETTNGESKKERERETILRLCIGVCKFQRILFNRLAMLQPHATLLIAQL